MRSARGRRANALAVHRPTPVRGQARQLARKAASDPPVASPCRADKAKPDRLNVLAFADSWPPSALGRLQWAAIQAAHR